MKPAKSATPASVRAKATRKAPRRSAKKTYDLSWLVDRPLPSESAQLENYVIVMRNRQ